ncbi:MAG: hypothetical protein ABIA93_05585 [Candidatus Woesearchaeota archaeon]
MVTRVLPVIDNCQYEKKNVPAMLGYSDQTGVVVEVVAFDATAVVVDVVVVEALKHHRPPGVVALTLLVSPPFRFRYGCILWHFCRSGAACSPSHVPGWDFYKEKWKDKKIVIENLVSVRFSIPKVRRPVRGA